jgi:hypothetical protein
MLYNLKAKVFAKKLGKDFSKTVYVTVVANDKEDAFKQGEQKFENLCTILEKNHNNIFDYTDLTIE